MLVYGRHGEGSWERPCTKTGLVRVEAVSTEIFSWWKNWLDSWDCLSFFLSGWRQSSCLTAIRESYMISLLQSWKWIFYTEIYLPVALQLWHLKWYLPFCVRLPPEIWKGTSFPKGHSAFSQVRAGVGKCGVFTDNGSTSSKHILSNCLRALPPSVLCSAKQGLQEEGWVMDGCFLPASRITWANCGWQIELPCNQHDQASGSTNVGLVDLKIGKKKLASDSHRRKNYKGHGYISHCPMIEPPLWLSGHGPPWIWLKCTSNDKCLATESGLPGSLEDLELIYSFSWGIQSPYEKVCLL